MKRLFLTAFLLLSGCIGWIPSYATVSSTTSKVIFTGDGVTSVFPFTFNIYRSTDLVVYKTTISTGVTTTLTLNSDYTVTLTHAAPTPGTVTLSAGALASTFQLTILRSLPLTQAIAISDYSITPAATWNEGYDRGVMLSQQLQEQLNRGLIGPVTSSTQLSLPTGVAGECLGWDGTGLALSNLTCSGGGGGGGGSAFNPPISDSQLQTITTGNKVNASAIYSLSSMPSGAGTLPIANIPVGTSASQIVQLTAATKYPAVDGSLITNLDGSNFANLASIPSGAGVIPSANIPGSTNHWQVFTSSGTFTAPTGVTQVFLTMVAGGGSGGCSLAGGTGGGSGGGGGGASVINRPYTVVAGNNYTVTVGAGGTPTSIGVDGAASVFDALTVTAGAHGVDGTAVGVEGAGGVGGANAATPLPLFSPGATTSTTTLTAPTSFIPGGNGAKATNNSTSGSGGSTPFGAGAAGVSSGSAAAGTAATANTGAGGSGATGADGFLHLGGNGGSGIVIVAY